MNEAELGHYTALDEADAEYRNACFEPTQEEMLRPADLDATLKSLTSSWDKIAFLYDKLWCNEAHNRFAWDEGLEASGGGCILAYGDSFSRLKWAQAQHKGDAAAPCEASRLIPEDVAALLYTGSFRWKWCYYSFLSIFSFGQKRRYYRNKKREMRKWLERAAKLRNAVRNKLGL